VLIKKDVNHLSLTVKAASPISQKDLPLRLSTDMICGLVTNVKIHGGGVLQLECVKDVWTTVKYAPME